MSEQIIAYISGPVTGMPRAKVERNFDNAEKTLASLVPGIACFNPVRQMAADTDYHDAMRICLLTLCSRQYPVNIVIQLDGWRNSKGARIEADVARILDIPCVQMSSQRLPEILNSLTPGLPPIHDYILDVTAPYTITGTAHVRARNETEAIAMTSAALTEHGTDELLDHTTRMASPAIRVRQIH